MKDVVGGKGHTPIKATLRILSLVILVFVFGFLALDSSLMVISKPRGGQPFLYTPLNSVEPLSIIASYTTTRL